MECKKCGITILETDNFCRNCGEPVPEMNLQNFNTNNQQNIDNTLNSLNQENGDINNQLYQNNSMNNSPFQLNENNSINNQPYQTNENIDSTVQNNYQQVTQTPVTENNNKNGKKRTVSKVLAIIGGVVAGIIILVIVLLLIVSVTSDKMVCTYTDGNITIMYNKKGLTGYKASGMTYDFDKQKEYAKQIGIDAYVKEFNSWFITNTSGSCTINGKKIETTPETNNGNIGNNPTVNYDTQLVGDEKYGYITIPSTWTKFYDVNGEGSLQYTYNYAYIVTLDVIDGENSAKTVASNYMYNKQNSSEVTGVTGATVTIGKNKQYTAYQVYMYYPSDGTYLVTYWFEAEDGKVHYISLEGPQEMNGLKITDYVNIPDSFTLTK